ncbi:hypothetical protein [Erythrobacter aurantius]|uniref:hypothetical protein n=1 Tax=Erythrobacter aurantius TaxID=2909249 RepID=UPI0020791F8A|nr:hypothetical protein [Erythrobacter aurantius]
MARNQNIELVRIASALGIVLFHSGAPGAAIGYSGLIAFTALSTYFANSDATKLAKRVLVPWLFWSIFYFAWRFAADGNPFHDGLTPLQSALYGTHLWFLPFIFVVNVVVSKLRSEHLPLVCSLLAFAFLAATPWWREIQLSFDPPLIQFLHAIPAALLGIAFRTRAGIAISALGLGVCMFWQIGGVSLPYALGGGAVMAAILLPRISLNVENVSACMLGVYLVHIAALGVFNRISGPETIITASGAFLASLVGVWLTRKFMPLSRSVLG